MGLMFGRIFRLAIALARSNVRLYPRGSDSKHQLLEARPYRLLARLELLFFAEEALALPFFAEDALVLPFFAVSAVALLFFAALFVVGVPAIHVLLSQIE